jgi:hypothetical protein
MKPSAFVAFGLAFSLSLLSNAKAEDRRSVERLLPGCRFEALQPAPVQDSEWEKAFECRDALAEAVKVGPIQPKTLASCVPENTSPHAVARAVVDILDRNPERYQERFDIRAATALHQAFPCR